MFEPGGRKLRVSARVNNGSILGEVFPTVKFHLNRRLLFAVANPVSITAIQTSTYLN